MSFIRRPNESPVRALLFWCAVLVMAAILAVAFHDLLPWHPAITGGAVLLLVTGERFLQLDEPR